ncbi:endocuticle structural glycoprotein ABD-5-like [Bicyclus anynana]|uniref:Endocuticle structural glycoprotein ABD-5-like n=1 Tax=Bicyclus anynana TaxID=110368 RepID=A0A6J1P8G0_BICAN|nr:endocuticle structural glycoprotein ABD-5-like [Bicyclus anynana]
MKLLVILACVALASAASLGQAPPSGSNPQDVQILRYETDNDGLGSYKYAFELSDGTKKEEQGELKNVGTENEAMSVKGSYSWTAPDGVTYVVTYVADENGFNPTIEQGPGGGQNRG